MPYIKKEDRLKFQHLNNLEIQNSGELNYAITLLLKNYLESHENNYQTRNDIVGAVEGAKTEFIRRKVNGYEDLKIMQNGDVY